MKSFDLSYRQYRAGSDGFTPDQLPDNFEAGRILFGFSESSFVSLIIRYLN